MMDGRGHAPVVEVVGQPGITCTLGSNHSRHRRTELDSCFIRKIPVYPAWYDDERHYRSGGSQDRGRVLLASSWSI
jgi:hypothetical protein